MEFIAISLVVRLVNREGEVSASQIFKSSVGKVYHYCGNFWCLGRAELQCIIYLLGQVKIFSFSGLRLLPTVAISKCRVLTEVIDGKCLRKSQKIEQMCKVTSPGQPPSHDVLQPSQRWCLCV